MNRTADLNKALGFAIGRIEEEATRSGEPLSDEQRLLLHHLPKDSALPQVYFPDAEFPAVLLPRDTAYERLCALAKAAHHIDLRLNPASAIDWEFAAAVSKLNVLAPGLGGRERAQAVVGRLASPCCFVAIRILGRGSGTGRGNRTVDTIPMDGDRCWIRRYLGPSALCFTTDRRMAG